jgi:Na+/glutamate symporter
MIYPIPSESQQSASDRITRVEKARRRQSQHGPAALLAMLAPAVALPIGLTLLNEHPRFAWLAHPVEYPWELWAVAVCGIIATIAGIADWRMHRSGHTVVSAREHRAHVLALVGGGLPLFVLMAIASLSLRPMLLLLPVLVVLIFTVVAICYDEFLFHRRCGRYETLMHRLLTGGNGLAFLAWTHWCFVRGGIDA